MLADRFELAGPGLDLEPFLTIKSSIFFCFVPISFFRLFFDVLSNFSVFSGDLDALGSEDFFTLSLSLDG